MKVIYRMCGVPSTNPSPLYQQDKFKLNKLCLESFKRGFNNNTPSQVFFILDRCDDRYESMVREVAGDWNINMKRTELGINDTMLLAYKYAVNSTGYVLFQECDYFYRPNIGKLFRKALKEFDIVSPYDHLNFYQDKNLHSDRVTLKLVDNYHFRTTERNTMTWGCHTDLIRKNYDIFTKYGYLDSDIWYELADRGYKLWVPIPSFATHMESRFLAPGVDWEKLWQKSIQ